MGVERPLELCQVCGEPPAVALSHEEGQTHAMVGPEPPHTASPMAPASRR